MNCKHVFLMMIALLSMIGCENTQRSLVFSTGTSWGIEIAVKPQTDTPINLLIGYKRAEILFDPIMEDSYVPCVTKSGRRTYTIKDQPHSVIAKLLGEVTGSAGGTNGANASMNVAQWFASGKAAELLVQSGGAAALTDDPNVAREIAKAHVGGFRVGDDRIPSVTFALINQLYTELDTIRKSDAYSPQTRAQADLHYAALDASPLIETVPERVPLYSFNEDTSAPQRHNLTTQLEFPITTERFRRVIDYRNHLAASVNALTQFRKAIETGRQITVDGVSMQEADEDQKKVLAKKMLAASDHYAKLSREMKRLEEAMLRDPAVVHMLRFLVGTD